MIDLQSMRNALVDARGASEDLLKQNDIEVSLDDAAMDESVRGYILDALEGAWDYCQVRKPIYPPRNSPSRSSSQSRQSKLHSTADSISLNFSKDARADDGYIKPALLQKDSRASALKKGRGNATQEATARKAAAILIAHARADTSTRSVLWIAECDVPAARGEEGAGADLLETVAGHQGNPGRRWEELRVPKLAEAVESGGLGVWAAVHDLASYAHASRFRCGRRSARVCR